MKLFQIIFLFSLLYLSASSPSEVIRVTTRQYEPFMYRNSSGAFVDGIEYALIKTIAKTLNMEVTFRPMSQDFHPPITIK